MNRSHLTRRELLALGLATSLTPNPLRTLFAAAAGTNPTPRRLVIVELVGGNDGFNTIVPHTNDAYYRSRPMVSIAPQELLKLDADFGFHPSLSQFASRFEQGRLAIVPGVGHAELSRSHFEARKQWYSASLDPERITHGGWIGRASSSPHDTGLAPSIFVGGGRPSQALEGTGIAAAAIERPNELSFPRSLLSETITPGATVAASSVVKTTPLSSARRALETARRVDHDLSRLRSGSMRTEDGEAKATTLVDRLGLAADLLRAELPTSVIYTTHGDYDTHFGQPLRHRGLLAELDSAISGFLSRIEDCSARDRTLLMVYSEFGRTLADNGQAGTDHGSPGLVFLFGTQVEPGLHGTWPEIANAETFLEREPRPTTDFRSIHATLLADWFGIDAAAVIGESVPRLGFVAKG